MCVFLNHVGQDPCSPHNNAEKSCQDFLDKKEGNRLRVKTSIDVVRWLTLQGCAFRGHDETYNSRNQGNFHEFITLLASYNDKVSKVVLDNTPRNVKYTSHMIQKEILHVLVNKVRHKICEDIGDSKFCIIIDKACDEFKRDNMRGEWNGLQALFLDDSHQLHFFSDLNFIVNIISASCKCHDQLQAAQAIEIANMLAIDGLETKNVIETVANKKITSFDFVFILHLVKEIIGIRNILSQHLQQKSQDIHNIEVIDMDSPYVHHYRVEIFNAVIDSQILELNTPLWILRMLINPSIRITICCVVKKYYPFNFTEQEKVILKYQLQHYKQNTIFYLCQGLAETQMSKVYFLVNRLIHLLLTFHISIATTERAFSAMKFVKTRLRNNGG
ncbi:hypothetical protein V6Z12_D09G008400 [Gossypium hirsutum]